MDTTKPEPNPQQNKRVETKTFDCFEQAAVYKQLQLDSGNFSKVKVVARHRKGTFDVCSFVPLKG